jgi:archaemetzincin
MGLMPRGPQLALLAVGPVARGRLERLRADLQHALAVRAEILPGQLDPGAARDPLRGQYNSSLLLSFLSSQRPTPDGLLLGVTELDLYIPVLTFVFGEAHVHGQCAIVSAHRLRQSFYGLPENSTLESERLLKEAIHEIGHAAGLLHCDDYECVMAPSHSVEWIDLKRSAFCRGCLAAQRRIDPAEPPFPGYGAA